MKNMKNFLIIGCGRFGQALAKQLYSLGNDVLAIDSNMEIIQDIADHVTEAIQMDATDEASLQSLGVNNFDVIIISIGSSMQSSIITTILIKELGGKEIICKAKDELQSKILYKIGADKVILPERDMGIKLARLLTSKNILEFIELDPKYSLIEIVVLDSWTGKSLIELNLRKKYEISVIAIKDEYNINISPAGEDVLKSGDILVILGENTKIEELNSL